MKTALTAFGAGFRDRQAERTAAFESALAFIQNDCVVTVDAAALTMEFTSPASPIIPLCIVQGRIVDGNWEMTTEAGPGQTVSTVLLAAAQVYARNRVTANQTAREVN